MSKFIISIGLINKYIYLPIIYMLIYIGMNIFWTFQGINEACIHLESFGSALGHIYVYAISTLFKYRRNKINNINKIEKSNKKYFKDFSILFVIITLFFIVDILQSYGLDLGKDSYIEYNIKDSLEIIFITLATFFILKYKYHIHHFISLAIFTLLTVIIDLILKYYQKINITSIILSFLYILIESVYYTYLKYLVENKYYYTFDIIGIFGAFNILLVIVSFSIEVIIHKVKGTNRLIFYFYFFYKEYQTWNMILQFIIGFIFEGFFFRHFRSSYFKRINT